MGDDSEISNHELGGNKIKGILFIYLIKDILNEQMKIVNHTHRYGKTDGWLPEVMGGVWIKWVKRVKRYRLSVLKSWGYNV